MSFYRMNLKILLYLQNDFAIAMCSRTATRGQKITTAPYSLIISVNAKSVPLKVVLNGGGVKSGSPPVTLPINKNIKT